MMNGNGMVNARRAMLLSAALAGALLLGGCASTKPIKAADGTAVEGSIARLEKVELLGVEQWLLIRAADPEKPVLLWLAGGPGGSEIGWTVDNLGELEERTVFVNWEQPGFGKSFRGADAREMSVDDYVDHTIAVSEYLAERFGKEKIYLVGHSWGSIIGLKAVARRPDLYHAYVGVGQQVNATENDQIGYEMVLDGARREGKTKVVETLQANGEPPYAADDPERRGAYYYLFSRLHHYSPVGPDMGRFNELAMFIPREYTLFDTINLLRGLKQGMDYIYPQLADLDFERDLPSVDVPVYFVTGRYDYTCVGEIAYRYYDSLEAPRKQFYWFERSGHNACFQEPERFVNLMIEDVLREEH